MNLKNINPNISNRTGGKVGQRNRSNNLYNQGINNKRNAIINTPQGKINRAKAAPKRANNVYADKKGGVVRHENGQWQNRSKKSWKSIPKQGEINSPARPSMQPHNQQPNNRQRPNNGSFDHKNMNRDLHGRQMGNVSRGGHQPTGNVRRGR